MYKTNFNKRDILRFKHFTRKGYALFCCLGKEVLIGTLAVPVLTYAKAEGISTKPLAETDSIALASNQEVGLDEVIVTGSRAPLTLQQSAKLVSVITREDINRAAAVSINDLLKLATGVDVRQRGGFGVQTDISINGGTFDQITILLNGVNISNPQTGHNASDFPVSLDDIERIEILEGAASRVLGTSAFNGAINIVTRKQGDKSHASVNMEGGSFGTFSSGAGIIHTTPSLYNHVSGSFSRSDGGTEHSDFEKYRFYYNGAWTNKKLSNAHQGSLNINWQMGVSKQNYGANTFYSPRFNNQFEQTEHDLASVNGQWTSKQGNWTVAPTLYFNRFYDHYQLIRGKEGAANGENYHRMDSYGASLNTYWTWNLGKTAIGGDIRKEHILSTALGELMPENNWKNIHNSEREYDHKGDRTNTSVFIEHNIVLDTWTLSAGLLANQNTGLDHHFRLYPGIDIAYRPDNHWKFYASWNKALRMPTYTDLYISNAVQQGDLGLKPEKNSTFKIGATLKQRLLEATLSSFYSNGTDMIDWVYENAETTKYHALNIGKLNNMGASADINIDLSALSSVLSYTSPHLMIGYAYIHQHHETDAPIYKSLYALEYLKHKITAQLNHRIWRNLSANWSFRWQERLNGFHPYAKIDAKLSWNTARYSLYIKADNLTCHRYYDLGGVLQPGLWMMVGGKILIN